MKEQRSLKVYILLFFLILVLFLTRISIGSVYIEPEKAIKLIFSKNSHLTDDEITLKTIVVSIRISSFVCSFLIGGILAYSGLVMQNLLKNPLAEPYTLGISSGASFGSVFALFLSSFFPFFYKFSTLFAVIGGIIAALIIFLIASISKSSRSSNLIISGIIVNSFFTAGITILFYLLGSKVNLALSWMMGMIPLFDKNWILIIIVEAIIFFIYFIFHKEFDLLKIAESDTSLISINAGKFKKIFFLVSSVGTSLIVSQSGIIPFIGIIIPYFIGSQVFLRFKKSLTLSFFIGGIFLVFLNILNCSVPIIFKTNLEIPIGALTGFLGAPFFLYLLIKKQV